MKRIGNCERNWKKKLFKTWHLIVTEAPVQMPLLFIGQCVALWILTDLKDTCLRSIVVWVSSVADHQL